MALTKFPTVAALLGLCQLGLGAACQKQPPPKPPPSIDGLTDALERTADKNLAVPSLANQTLVVPEKSGLRDVQMACILDAAKAAGGAAIPGDDKILATIPRSNVESFMALVRSESVIPANGMNAFRLAADRQMNSAIPQMQNPASVNELIDVVVQSPTHSPTP